MEYNLYKEVQTWVLRESDNGILSGEVVFEDSKAGLCLGSGKR